VNHKVDRQTPRFDVQLIFEEIGITLDDHQYRDAISLVDMYHVYLRKRQVSPFLSLFTFPDRAACCLVWEIPPFGGRIQY
jgi:Vacuolar sorting-associated protein 13, N-terminal